MGMADTGSTLDVTGLADTVLYGDYSQSGLTAGDPAIRSYRGVLFL
jgi:hypothetical protein